MNTEHEQTPAERIAELVTALAEARGAAQKAVEDEQSRWAGRIYRCLLAHLPKGTADYQIDGAGCDSGDPLDVAEVEVCQALRLWAGEAEQAKLQAASTPAPLPLRPLLAWTEEDGNRFADLGQDLWASRRAGSSLVEFGNHGLHEDEVHEVLRDAAEVLWPGAAEMLALPVAEQKADPSLTPRCPKACTGAPGICRGCPDAKRSAQPAQPGHWVPPTEERRPFQPLDWARLHTTPQHIYRVKDLGARIDDGRLLDVGRYYLDSRHSDLWEPGPDGAPPPKAKRPAPAQPQSEGEGQVR